MAPRDVDDFLVGSIPAHNKILRFSNADLRVIFELEIEASTPENNGYR